MRGPLQATDLAHTSNSPEMVVMKTPSGRGPKWSSTGAWESDCPAVPRQTTGARPVYRVDGRGRFPPSERRVGAHSDCLKSGGRPALSPESELESYSPRRNGSLSSQMTTKVA